MSLEDKFNEIIEKHGDVLKNLAKNRNKEELEESSLSRIWQHVTDDNRSFAMISASRGKFSDDGNLARHEALKNIVRIYGYGFVETQGGYREGEDGGEIVEEPSLFVPEIPLNDAVELGQFFSQDTVLYKDSDFFGYVGSSQVEGVGSVVMNFKKDVDHVLDLTNVEEFFSALVKGSHAGRRFVFRPE